MRTKTEHKLTWDTCQIAEDQAAYLQEEDPTLSDEDAFSQACADHDILTWAYDDMTECLTEYMHRINPHRRPWIANASNFGWRHLQGTKEFTARDGAALLREVLPDTDCTYTIRIDLRRHLIEINNAHHDAPMGGEMYYIRPMTLRQYDAWH